MSGLPTITGEFNIPDRHGHVLPWSYRSARELVEMCLEASGETNYRIDLPHGGPLAHVKWENRPATACLIELAVLFRLRLFADKGVYVVAPLGGA